MRKIIFHASNLTHVNKFNRLSNYLNDRGFDTCLIDDRVLDEGVSRFDKAIIKVLIRPLMVIAKVLIINENVKEPVLASLYKSLIKVNERCLRKKYPPMEVRYIITASDRAFGWEQSLRYYCIKNNVRHVILPVSRASTMEEMSKTINYNVNKYGLLRYADHFRGVKFQQKYKQTSIRVQNVDYYYYPYWMLSALNTLELLQVDPFVLGSSPHTTVLCGSVEHKNSLKVIGKSFGKIKLTGYLDYILHKNLNKRHILEKYFGLYRTKNDKLAIVALPPLLEHDLSTKIGHWKVILYILSNVAKIKNFNWLVSLHPKMHRNVYEKVCKRYNLKVIDENFYDLAMIADFAIVYEGSTLVDVMESLNKPSVVCGWWGFNYSRKYRWPVIFIKDRRDLTKGLNEILSV